MADQLLSQADVDALVSSLSKSEPMKPAPPKPAAAAPPKPAATNSPAPSNAGAKPVNNQAPKTPLANTVSSNPASLSPVRNESKSEIPSDAINAINAKIADLNKQMSQIGIALKQLDLMGKKIADLEMRLNTGGSNQAMESKVQQLTEALKKITANLKDTPGYGVRHTFKCEKCSDQEHVAVMYRCTSCGHQRWYGWWPDK